MITDAEWSALAESVLSELNIEELIAKRIVLADGRFLPVITYPPIVMYPPATPQTVFDSDANPPTLPTAAYVHVPFCASQCDYCHWIKKISPPSNEVDDYLETLSLDMDLVVKRLGLNKLPVSSVLFGGGTPTYPSLEQMERMLTDFTKHFDLSTCRQFSFEAEPRSTLGEHGLAKLKLLKQFGVNRISLGVQSFQDHVLKSMGRPHSGDEAVRSIEQIRKAGIESISIDLIYGYPGQSVGDWLSTLRTALKAGVDAWHLYRLRILQHGDIQGPIINKYQDSTRLFPEVREIYLMKAIGLAFSEKNDYGQHFTRIFAKGRKHVTQFMWDYCCNLTDVAGVGISAWANYHRTFTQNVGSDFDIYRQMVRSGRLPIDRGLFRDNETEARRSFISPLKNDKVYKKRFSQRTGIDPDAHFGPELDRLEKLGLLTRKPKTVALTSRGRFFADETVMQLHQRQYLPFEDMAHDLMPD